MFLEYYEYTENLLVAQHGVSHIISHPVVKGEIREHFLKEVIEKTFPGDINLYRGLVSADPTDQNQIDLFVKRRGAQTMNFGNHFCIHPEDCMLMVEVKSAASGKDIADFNLRAKKIKTQCVDNKPLCGMFCYKINLQKDTLLKRFGYEFNEDAVAHIINDELPIDYPHLDFIVNIDQDVEEEVVGTNQVFLRKDTAESGFVLSHQYPVIKEFLGMIQSLLR
jgi:hypothetical protein